MHQKIVSQMTPKEQEENAEAEFIKRMAFPENYRPAPPEERNDLNWYIRKWGPAIFFIVIGFFIGGVFKRPEYKEYPARAIEGEHVQRQGDSLFYMSIRIDSAILEP